MEMRTFGRTGLEVTPLGFGGAEVGVRDLSAEEKDRVLCGILDAGINVLDTAACYGESEETIGRAVGDRRDEFVLVTKCGHSVAADDPPEWTAEVVAASLDRSLGLLKTDRVDVLLLHSCGAEHFQDEGLMGALEKAKSSGKARFVGYSGDAADAEEAVALDVFDVLETSVSICDQQGIERYLPGAREAGLGVLAKRPIANAAWLGREGREGFYRDYVTPYVERLTTMGFTPESLGFDGSWVELALRFTVFQPGVHTAIVGTTNLDHVRENVKLVEKGRLPEDVVTKLRDLWRLSDDGSWVGQG